MIVCMRISASYPCWTKFKQQSYSRLCFEPARYILAMHLMHCKPYESSGIYLVSSVSSIFRCCIPILWRGKFPAKTRGYNKVFVFSMCRDKLQAINILHHCVRGIYCGFRSRRDIAMDSPLKNIFTLSWRSFTSV